MSVLLTGFEPFDGERVNPSQEIVRALDGAKVGAHRVVGAVLPVAFGATPALVDSLIERHRPALVIATGQAGGRSELSIERVAINLIDARIEDADGRQPIDEPVVAGAPPAYFSTLPVKAMLAHLNALGIPAAPSFTAGSYVCNQVFFLIAHRLATTLPSARGGFVHVPWLPEQAADRPGQPSMALETMVAGLRAAIGCALATADDLHRAAGTIA
ncbi:MAG TPA: pyroglutamyl-peptidase I [Dokdonella sp.]